jgi:hypothetical protein
MLPDFIRARATLKKRQHSFLIDKIREFTPAYMRQASYKNICEGSHLSVRYENGMVYEKPTSVIRVETQTEMISELKANPNTIYAHLTQMAKDFVEQQIKHMFQTLAEVSEMTGNVVEGGEFNVDSVFAILEKMSISFDESGQPVFPSIFTSPNNMQTVADILLQIESDPVLKPRHEQLIETKRTEWNDRQNFRKLVG